MKHRPNQAPGAALDAFCDAVEKAERPYVEHELMQREVDRTGTPRVGYPFGQAHLYQPQTQSKKEAQTMETKESTTPASGPFLKMSEVMAMLAVGQRQLEGMISRGLFPAPVQLTDDPKDGVRFLSEDVTAWVASRKRFKPGRRI